MGFPIELFELLKHTDVEGKKLTRNLLVNTRAVEVKLLWIKANNFMVTMDKVASHATKISTGLQMKKKCSAFKQVKGKKELSRC
jgi:hypothetical protein